MTQSPWFQNTITTVVAVVLLLVLFFAFVQGNRAGQSKMVLENTAAIQKGFQYFFNDQGRYPTALEFTDNNLMRSYITHFPPEEFAAGSCEKSFDYKSSSPRTYELQFCLPKGRAGWPAGWSLVKP
jgi:hypothetical protein